MKIGILQTDTVPDTISAQFGDYPAMFQRLFLRVEPRLEFAVFNVVQGDYPATPNACDGYVITGSKASVYDGHEWIATLGDYCETLYREQRKLLAVCFGHQLVAEVFGGKTEQSAKGWGVGVHSMDIVCEKPWMQPVAARLNVIASHQDQVTQLPPDAQRIASSAFCENSMFQLGDNILTIQGHPEFSKDYARTMMQYRAAKLGPETLNAGLASLQKPVDDLTIAQWLLAFIVTGQTSATD